MTLEELQARITAKHISDADLSELNLHNIDFSDCTLKNVRFSNEKQEKVLTNLNFKNAKLENVYFENATLDSCNFDFPQSVDDKSIITSLCRVSFRKSKLSNCRFRLARMQWCDFRYTEINHATFEDALIEYCDFYRSFFFGVIIMRKALISNTSLYYTYFSEGVNIRKENFKDGKLLQENKKNYHSFLVDWKNLGTGVRTNNQNQISDWSPNKSLQARFADAEEIFKNLNGLWNNKGFVSDANWAYVKGRRMERKRMIVDLQNKMPLGERIETMGSIFINFLFDFSFGYGESMLRMIQTYILTVFFFAFFYYANTDLSSYLQASWISLKNMVGISSSQLTTSSPFIDMLNMLQTTIGILLTGIFGFILGNKIRNQ